MSYMNYETIAEVLKIIAHADRLRIIELLEKKALTGTDIQNELNIKQSVTSQHLNNLKNRGILECQRAGNMVYYSIAEKEVLKIISCIKKCLDKRR